MRSCRSASCASLGSSCVGHRLELYGTPVDKLKKSSGLDRLVLVIEKFAIISGVGTERISRSRSHLASL